MFTFFKPKFHDQFPMKTFYDKFPCSCKQTTSLYHMYSMTSEKQSYKSGIDWIEIPLKSAVQAIKKAAKQWEQWNGLGLSKTCQAYLPGHLHEQFFIWQFFLRHVHLFKSWHAKFGTSVLVRQKLVLLPHLYVQTKFHRKRHGKLPLEIYYTKEERLS